MTDVHLELLDASHVPDIAALVDDPDVLRFTRVPANAPADFPQQWLALYDEGRRTGTREAFAVRDADGTFIGLAMSPRLDREAR